MRRQRVWNPLSAQSVCIFCACRLAVDLPPPTRSAPFISPATSGRRALHTTRISLQSDTTANPAREPNATPVNGIPQWTGLDSPSPPLTLAEQEEKSRRMQRKREHDEALAEQRKQQATARANEARPAQQAQNRGGSFNRSGNSVPLQTISHTRHLRLTPRPHHDVKSAAIPLNSNMTDATGLSQAMSKGLQEGQKQAVGVYSAGSMADQGVKDPQNPRRGFVLKKIEVNSEERRGYVAKGVGVKSEEQVRRRQIIGRFAESRGSSRDPRPASSNSNGNNPLPGQATKRSARVANPFAGSAESKATDTVQAVSGWGRGATETKPLEYGDASQPKTSSPLPIAGSNKGPQEPSRDQVPIQQQQAFLPQNHAEAKPHSEQRSILGSSLDNGHSDIQPDTGTSFHAHLDKYNGTGYRATPFNANEICSKPPPLAEEGVRADWHHLRRQNNTISESQTPQQQPQNPSELHSESTSQVDESFERSMIQRQPTAANVTHSPTATHSQPPLYDRTRYYAEKVCARCGQKGHIAVQCSKPQEAPLRRLTRRLAIDTPFENSNSVNSNPTASDRLGRRKSYNVLFDDTPAYLNRDKSTPQRIRNLFGQSDVLNLSVPSHDAGSDSVVFRPFGLPKEANTMRESQSSSGEAASTESDGSVPQPSPQTSVEMDERERRRTEKAEKRQARWEHGESDVEGRGRMYDRRKGRRSGRRGNDEEEDEQRLARDEYQARKTARQAAKEKDKADKKKEQQRRLAAMKAGQPTPITLPEFISIQNLSQMLRVRYEDFIRRLEDLGYDDLFAGKTLNSETSGMIAMEYNFEPTFGAGAPEEMERDLQPQPEVEDKESLPVRPSVVTIMGHVDHGKTTILDYLRKSSVAAGEAGGITQHIGAFSVPLTSSGKTVTFLDTPGHAAFLAMRQRGANVTDIVVLVVAADDSVKPQTLEALKHAKAAGVPIIVAINKIDKEGADVQRCKQDLARHGVEIEDFGGDTQVVCVSGKTGLGMDELEENVVTLSEILDHRADVDGAVEGWVLEATTKAAGRVATVLVRRGTLRPGCILVAGKTWARVRTLKNEGGQDVDEVRPGMPVEVDGWKDQPAAGDEVLETNAEQKATSVVEFRQELAERYKAAEDMETINEARRARREEREREKAAELAAKLAAKKATAMAEDGAPVHAPEAVDTSASEQQPGQMTVPFIIKADVSGSAEAVSAYILSVSNPLVAPRILQSGVGPISEFDVDLASTASAHIIAFNLPKNEVMRGAAESRGVKVLENNIIYRVLDDVKGVLEEKLPPLITQRVTGEAEIAAAFDISIKSRKTMKIAGCKVRNGVVSLGGRVRVLRDGEKVYDGTLTSLKNVKKDVKEMRKGTECGIGFADWQMFEVGDQVQVYEEISEKRRL